MKNIPIKLALFAALVFQASGQNPDPDRLFKDAVAAQLRGELGAAVELYRQVVILNPNLAPAWVDLAVALAQVGEFDEAIKSYRAALAIDPANRQVQLNLGLAWFKKGDFATASQHFAEMLRKDPKDIRVAVLLGASYLQMNDSSRALAVLEPLTRLAGDNPDFLWAFGSALIANGRLREGTSFVERAAGKLNAAGAWLLAGQNRLTLNEFGQARTDLENAARINSLLPGVLTALGQASEKNADYEAAIAAYAKAVEQNPRDFDAWLGLGSDQYFLRHLEAAKASLTRALAIDPESAPARYGMALVQKGLGQPEAAVGNLEHAVKLRPDWLEAHIQLAALYFQIHRTEDGARERRVVDQLAAEQQKNGPGKL